MPGNVQLDEDGPVDEGCMPEYDERAATGLWSRTKRIRVLVAAVVVLTAAILSIVTSLDENNGNTPAPTPEGSDDECHLASGHFAIAVQGALLGCVIMVLVYKRHRERPRRPVKIWAMDTSKQAASNGAAHLLAMAAAMVLGRVSEQKYECGWYIVAFCLDTSFGVWVALRLLRMLELTARERGWGSLQESGFYKAPDRDHDPIAEPDCGVWFRQLLSFVAIVLCARVCCITLLFSLLWVLKWPVQGMTDAFRGHPKAFLVTVMLLGPGCLNLLQAWIQDNFLARRAAPAKDTTEVQSLVPAGQSGRSSV